MASDIEVNWVDILNKFSSYQGTIVKFCDENGINPHQLYYQRKKASNTNPPLFHGIKVNKKDPLVSQTVQGRSDSKENTQIKVEIGKAKIYIPSHDMLALENILQIVIGTC